MFDCKIIADSKNTIGNRITTFKVTFPRFILAEMNTHRMFSRNSASSRAIPFKKMIEMVKTNPFIPIAWQKDHKGMQGSDYFSEKHGEMLRNVWLEARDKAIVSAENLHFGIGVQENGDELYNISVTKQLCNRLLEPFMWHTAIITATEFENFFALRCPKYSINLADGVFRSKKDLIQTLNDLDKGDFSKIEEEDNQYWLYHNQGQAEIHIMKIAEMMWDAYNESEPKQLQDREWHIPYGDNFYTSQIVKLWNESELGKIYGGLPANDFCQQMYLKGATARCARVSYETLGDNPKIDLESDIKLHDSLSQSGHWSPFEHIARAMSIDDVKANGEYSGNFKGFTQYRKLFANENIC